MHRGEKYFLGKTAERHLLILLVVMRSERFFVWRVLLTFRDEDYI